MAWTYPAAILLIIAALRGGTGGTLADAAFYESIRRAIGPKAERSLTMADVPAPDPRVAAAATPPAVDDPAKAIEPAKATDPALDRAPDRAPDRAKDERGTESEWRERALAARAALERDEVLHDAMQSRVNALTNDVTSRDDPAQRAELVKQRARALSEFDRLTLQVEKDKLAIAALEEEARKKGVPPGWIRL